MMEDGAAGDVVVTGRKRPAAESGADDAPSPERPAAGAATGAVRASTAGAAAAALRGVAPRGKSARSLALAFMLAQGQAMPIGAAVAPPASWATTTSSLTLSAATLSATTLATPLHPLIGPSPPPPPYQSPPFLAVATIAAATAVAATVAVTVWRPSLPPPPPPSPPPSPPHPGRHSHHHRPRHRCCRRRHILCSCSRMGYCCASCYRPAQRSLCQAQVAVAVSSRTAHCRCGAAHPCRDRCLTRRLCRGSTVRGTSLPSIPSGHLPPALTSSTPPGTTRCSQPPCHSYPPRRTPSTRSLLTACRPAYVLSSLRPSQTSLRSHAV